MNKFDEAVEVNAVRGVAHNDEHASEKDSENAALLHETLARTGKSTSAFKTISEVAEELAVQQHVLRFWETKFSQVRPLKRGGGRRYYRPEDVQLLHAIHNLLYTEGYTIKGVQKLLRDMGKKKVLDGVEVVSAKVAGTPKKEPEITAIAAQTSVQLLPQTKLFVSQEAESTPPVKLNRNALTASQKETLDGLLSELKEIRDLIKEKE